MTRVEIELSDTQKAILSVVAQENNVDLSEILARLLRQKVVEIEESFVGDSQTHRKYLDNINKAFGTRL